MNKIEKSEILEAVLFHVRDCSDKQDEWYLLGFMQAMACSLPELNTLAWFVTDTPEGWKKMLVASLEALLD